MSDKQHRKDSERYVIEEKVVPVTRSLLSAECPFCLGDSTYWVDEHGVVEPMGVCEHFSSHAHGSAVFEKAADRKEAVCPFCGTKAVVEYHGDEILDHQGCYHLDFDAGVRDGTVLFTEWARGKLCEVGECRGG